MIPLWVKDYVGLPFEEYNCWQLICKVYSEQLSITLPFLDNRYTDPYDKKAIMKLYTTELERVWVPTKTPSLWAAVVFRVQGQLWHVGLVLDKEMMLHTHDNINSAVERFTNNVWRHRIEGFYNYAG